jgi:hypothetical protein
MGVDMSSFVTARDTEGFTPAMYVLKDDVGFAELLRRVSTLLPAGVLRLRANITGVARPPASALRGSLPVLVQYTQDGLPHTLRCGALVNTAAQALPNLRYLELDEVETAQFKPVYWCRYFTTALMLTPKLKYSTGGVYTFSPPADSGRFLLPRSRRDSSAGPRPAAPFLSALGDPGPYAGEVTTFVTVYDGAANRPPGVPYSADPGLINAYSYSDVDMSADEVAAKAARMIGGKLRRAEVRKTYSFLYYPRVSEAQLRSGWFERLEAMQGRRGTYHCGGLTTFWDVEHAMRSGQELVARYF